MADTLLAIGVVCILAAIVGGGLKAFGIELPALQSWGCQAVLAIFGLILVAADYTPSPAPEVELFDTKNKEGVSTPGIPPHQPAQFSIARPYYVTFIWNIIGIMARE